MSKIALTLSFAQSQDMAGMKCQQLVFFAIRRRRDQSVSGRIMLFIAMQEL